MVILQKKQKQDKMKLENIYYQIHWTSAAMFVMDLGTVHKSLIDVTALSRTHNSSYVINPTFILNPLTYLQVCTLKLYSSKSTPIERYIHIYMSLSHDCIKTLIGCFLIQILSGTSIIYASQCAHAHITLHHYDSITIYRDSGTWIWYIWNIPHY